MLKSYIIIFLFIANSCFASSMKMIGEEEKVKITRVITVNMYDNYFEPREIKVKKGETVKFLKNLGELVHEYNIATKEMHLNINQKWQRWWKMK